MSVKSTKRGPEKRKGMCLILEKKSAEYMSGLAFWAKSMAVIRDSDVMKAIRYTMAEYIRGEKEVLDALTAREITAPMVIMARTSEGRLPTI